MNETRQQWLAADYHFPSTYSCRLPMSSTSSASVSPAPGPATIRLALLRVGIELLGMDETRESVFPLIRAMSVRVRPPEKVALSHHVLRAYKAEEVRGSMELNESLISREMAHAHGPMTVYIEVPVSQCEMWTALLMTIGYWGQANSFASCLQVRQEAPNDLECATPFQHVREEALLRPFFCCVLTEFRGHDISWDEVVAVSGSRQNNPLRLDVYVWPLLRAMHHGGGKLLTRSSFPQQ